MTLIVNGEKIEDSAIQKEVERMRPRYEEVFATKTPGSGKHNYSTGQKIMLLK